MEPVPKSPSIDSGRGSSTGGSVQKSGGKYIGESMESIRSSTPSTTASQLSLASSTGKSDSDTTTSQGKKKKRSLSFIHRKKTDIGTLPVKSHEAESVIPDKKSKIKNPFRKKSKEKMEPLSVVAENTSTVRHVPVEEVKKEKKKISLVSSFKKKKPKVPLAPACEDLDKDELLVEEPYPIPGPSAKKSETMDSITPNPVENIPHLVDLETEPKRITSSRKSSATTEDLNETDIINPEISQENTSDLHEPPSKIQEEMNDSKESQSQFTDPEEQPAINYGVNAQRIRIKKPNLQRETLERIFLQRRESENEVDVGRVPSPVEEKLENGDGEVNMKDSNNAEEDEKVEIIEEVESDKGAFDDDEVEIVEEYLQSDPTHITVSMFPEPFDAFQKRLSIISEGGSGFSESNLTAEHCLSRRASDFTDSFKKLEPFKFDLPGLTEGKRERLYKVLVVGELGTGKTSIIKRYVHQFFSQHYRATIGVDFALKVLRWDPETVVRLQLWDIAGQERFGSMTRVYYKEAVGAFVVFDVTRGATLEAVPKWKADLDSKVVLPDGRPIPAVLLANKSDQPKEGLAANRDKMNEFCQQQGFAAWFETSAKENINIDESANFLVSKILEMDKWSQEPISSDPDKVTIAHGGGSSRGIKDCAC